MSETPEIVFTVFKDKYSQGVVLGRTELYQKVWANTLSRTAREYGIGGHHLKLVCTRLKVPTPSSEYWQARERGRDIPIPPLLEAPDVPERVRVTFRLKPGMDYPAQERTDARKLTSSEAPARREDFHCSFCGKHQHEVRKLIKGPYVYICDECVQLCVNLLDAQLKQSSGDKSITPTPHEVRLQKAFDRLERYVRELVEAFSGKVDGFKTHVEPEADALIATLKAGLLVGRLGDIDRIMGTEMAEELQSQSKEVTRSMMATQVRKWIP